MKVELKEEEEQEDDTLQIYQWERKAFEKELIQREIAKKLNAPFMCGKLGKNYDDGFRLESSDSSSNFSDEDVKAEMMMTIWKAKSPQ